MYLVYKFWVFHKGVPSLKWKNKQANKKLQTIVAKYIFTIVTIGICIITAISYSNYSYFYY